MFRNYLLSCYVQQQKFIYLVNEYFFLEVSSENDRKKQKKIFSFHLALTQGNREASKMSLTCT